MPYPTFLLDTLFESLFVDLEIDCTFVCYLCFVSPTYSLLPRLETNREGSTFIFKDLLLIKENCQLIMAGESQILNDPADAVEAGVSRSNDIGHTISEVHSGY